MFICADHCGLFRLNYVEGACMCCLNCRDSCMKCLDPGFKAEIASVPFDFADSQYSGSADSYYSDFLFR